MTGGQTANTAAGSGALRVAVLGGFSVRVGGRTVPDVWRLRKSKTLVKLLALAEGHRAHRDMLTEVLWPDLDLAAASNNLHQALHDAADCSTRQPGPGQATRPRPGCRVEQSASGLARGAPGADWGGTAGCWHAADCST